MFRINKRNMEIILPSNVRESKLISEDAKKVLTALMYSLNICEGAEESGVLIISNAKLRSILKMKRDDMLHAIGELEFCDLIKRVKGRARVEGEKATASEYHFNWDAIYNKPLRMKSSREIFARFINMQQQPKPSTKQEEIEVACSEQKDEESKVEETHDQAEVKVDYDFKLEEFEMYIKLAKTRDDVDDILVELKTLRSTNEIPTKFDSKFEKLEELCADKIKLFSKESVDYHGTFIERVKEEFKNSTTEEQCIELKADLFNELNKKRLVIGVPMYNRCRSFLMNTFNDKLDEIEVEIEDSSPLPF